MPAAVHVQLQLRIVGDDGTVFTDNEILRFKKSPGRLKALDLSLQEDKTLQGAPPAAGRHRSGARPTSTSIATALP